MPIQIVKQDITKIKADAIVNPTDCSFSGSGGVDYLIHKAAGKEMDSFCSSLDGISIGEAVFSPGYGLPCEYVIHTAGPVWKGGKENETALLKSCYTNSLITASALNVKSVAFPLISSGTFGFPKDIVMSLALRTISDFLFENDYELNVSICVTDNSCFVPSCEQELSSYITSKTADTSRAFFGRSAMPPFSKRRTTRMAPAEPYCSVCEEMPCMESATPGLSLDEWLKKQDDSFAVTLLKLIDRKGISDVECYKKANVSRKTFSKINNEKNYKPSKQTVIAFAIALELSLDEAQQLLKTVGFSLSHSNTFDLIIEFFISNGIYDIYKINEALYKYDQICLGC